MMLHCHHVLKQQTVLSFTQFTLEANARVNS